MWEPDASNETEKQGIRALPTRKADHLVITRRMGRVCASELVLTWLGRVEGNWVGTRLGCLVGA